MYRFFEKPKRKPAEKRKGLPSPASLGIVGAFTVFVLGACFGLTLLGPSVFPSKPTFTPRPTHPLRATWTPEFTPNVPIAPTAVVSLCSGEITVSAYWKDTPATSMNGIYTMNGDGTNTRLARLGKPSADGSITYNIAYCSPDRTKIASCQDGTLYVSDAMQTASTALNVPCSPRSFSFSPDSKRLVYIDEHRVYTIAIDGRDRQAVTSGADYFVNTAAYSPIDQRIAFTGSLRHPDPVTPVPDIPPTYLFLVNADGSGLTQLKQAVLPDQIAWSPDGQTLAYLEVRYEKLNSGGEMRICLISITDSDQGCLTSPEDNAVDPVWSPDGKRIAFTQITEFVRYIIIAHLDGSQKVRLPTVQKKNVMLQWLR